MAVKRYANRVPVDELIDLLVIREIPGLEQAVAEGYIRHHPRTPDLPAIDRPYLDDPVGITKGERQRGPVEIDNHAGDRGIDIGRDPVRVPEENTGIRIAIIPEFVITHEQ